jgi:hypothetical protein
MLFRRVWLVCTSLLCRVSILGDYLEVLLNQRSNVAVYSFCWELVWSLVRASVEYIARQQLGTGGVGTRSVIYGTQQSHPSHQTSRCMQNNTRQISIPVTQGMHDPNHLDSQGTDDDRVFSQACSSANARASKPLGDAR